MCVASAWQHRSSGRWKVDTDPAPKRWGSDTNGTGGPAAQTVVSSPEPRRRQSRIFQKTVYTMRASVFFLALYPRYRSHWTSNMELGLLDCWEKPKTPWRGEGQRKIEVGSRPAWPDAPVAAEGRTPLRQTRRRQVPKALLWAWGRGWGRAEMGRGQGGKESPGLCK